MPTFLNEKENANGLYSTTVKDETRALVQVAAVTSITLTLYNKHDSAIVNSRDAVNVFNANGGTFANGAFTFEFTPLDKAIINDTLPYENRVALFEYTYGAGTRKTYDEIEFQVVNAVKVP